MWDKMMAAKGCTPHGLWYIASRCEYFLIGLQTLARRNITSDEKSILFLKLGMATCFRLLHEDLRWMGCQSWIPKIKIYYFQYTKLGHSSEEITQAMETVIGFFIGMSKPCKACVEGKEKKAGVSKIVVPQSTVKGKILFIDISSASTASMASKKHWLLIVDDNTDYFLKEKSELNDLIMCLFKHLWAMCSVNVRYVCNDNSGENEAFEWLCIQEGIDVHFEYTSPGTWQQNGPVERKFAIFCNWVCALINGGKFSSFLRNGLCAETNNTAMLLNNNLVTKSRDLSFFNIFFENRKEIFWLLGKNLVKCV